MPNITHTQSIPKVRHFSSNTPKLNPKLFPIIGFLIGTGGAILYGSRQRSEEVKEKGLPENLDTLNDVELQKLIKNLVKQKDTESILQLIKLLQERDDTEFKLIHFPNIDQGHLWEIDIRDALIKARELEMIKTIFPNFCSQTLNCTHVFLKPISQNDFELVQTMLEGGMKPFVKGKNRFSPDVLVYTLIRDNRNIAKLLLEQGGYDINGCYRFSVRGYEEKNDIDRYVGDTITPAYLAVVMKNADLLKQLIEWGADINTSNQRPDDADKYRMSTIDAENPLIRSITHNVQNCFDLLLEQDKIDLNFRSNSNCTPLMIAASTKRYDMVLKLIHKGVDVNALDASGRKAITWIAREGSPALFKALMEAGTKLNFIEAGCNYNLWHYITLNPHCEELCGLLIEGGIHSMINCRDMVGRTPLLHAFERNDKHAVKVLLAFGADTTAIRNLQNQLPNFFEKSVLENLEEFLSILDSSPPVLIAPPILSETRPLNMELNSVILKVGTQEEIVNKIHKSAPICNGDFVQNLANMMEMELNPVKLIDCIRVADKIYTLDPTTKGLAIMNKIFIPEMLSAFSDDETMQQHLRDLWELSLKNPEEFEVIRESFS